MSFIESCMLKNLIEIFKKKFNDENWTKIGKSAKGIDNCQMIFGKIHINS